MSQFGLILLTVGLTCAAAAIVIDMVSLPPRDIRKAPAEQ